MRIQADKHGPIIHCVNSPVQSKRCPVVEECHPASGPSKCVYRAQRHALAHQPAGQISDVEQAAHIIADAIKARLSG